MISSPNIFKCFKTCTDALVELNRVYKLTNSHRSTVYTFPRYPLAYHSSHKSIRIIMIGVHYRYTNWQYWTWINKQFISIVTNKPTLLFICLCACVCARFCTELILVCKCQKKIVRASDETWKCVRIERGKERERESNVFTKRQTDFMFIIHK